MLYYSQKGGGDLNSELFSKIYGQSILIINFTIEYHEETLTIKMSCVSKDQNAYFIVFKNVTKLSFSEISYPFYISGFCGKIHHLSDRFCPACIRNYAAYDAL